MKINARKFTFFALFALLMSVGIFLPFAHAEQQYYPNPTFTVTASINYPGAGTLTPSNGTCTYNFDTYVVYTEVTNPGYSFNGWYLNGIYEGDLSSIPLFITQNCQLIAVFSVSLAYLTVSSSPGGVTSIPTGIWNYTYGSVVSIQEFPSSGATFSGWYLDGTYMGTTPTLTVTMNQDNQVNAYFAGGSTTSTPAPTVMPAPTPNPNLLAPALQFYCTSSTSYSTFNIEIQGGLIYNNSGLVNTGIYLSYSVTNGATWQPFAYVETSEYGNFTADWMPSSSGDYLIQAVYFGDNVYSAETSTVNFDLTPLENQNQSVFSVTSNSTVTSLAFDSTTDSLSFGVSGPSGTTGYSQICISKTLLPNVSSLTMTLDNSGIAYSSFSSGSDWLITITYHHSSHTIVMNLNSQASLASPTSTIAASTPTSTTTPTASTASDTSTPTSIPSPSPESSSPTPTASIPEFSLVILPILLAMVGLAIMTGLKKRRKINLQK